ncbi:MAG: PadR family transcriptional regulator [Hyphomicrobiales bacterium]|nr:MAG: PadR family transcriptional regulator [Hyphomicrobiales bacterium]
MTMPTQVILSTFDSRPSERLSGADIFKCTGIGSGTIYPVLIRLEKAGWLKSEKEKIDPREVGRPARTFYRLTPQGARRFQRVLASKPLLVLKPMPG